MANIIKAVNLTQFNSAPQSRTNTNYGNVSFSVPWLCVPQNFDGSVEAYFEAVIGVVPAPFTGTAQLFNLTGGLSVTELHVTGSAPFRIRSANIWSSLVSGSSYIVRIKSSNATGTCSIWAARVLIYQSGTITKTESYYDLSTNTTTQSGTFVTNVVAGYWKYDPTHWHGLSGIYFEGLISHSLATGTAYGRIANADTDATIVNSEISIAGITDTFDRSANFIDDLVSGTVYVPAFRSSYQAAGQNTRMRGSRLTFFQTNPNLSGSVSYFSQTVGNVITSSNTTGNTHIHRWLFANNEWNGITGTVRWVSTQFGSSTNTVAISRLIDIALSAVASSAVTGTVKRYAESDIVPIGNLTNNGEYDTNVVSSPATQSTYNNGHVRWVYNFVVAGGASPVTVGLSTLGLTGSAISLTVVPGAATVALSSLGLTGSAIGLTVVGGAVTVPLSSLHLTGSAISLTPVGGAVSVPLSSLSLTGSAISLSVVPGATTVPLSTLGLSGSAISLAVVPGAVTVPLSTLGLTGSAITLAVSFTTNVTVVLSTLGLTGSANSLTVVPGAATVALSSLGLTGSAVPISVLPGAVSLMLNTLGLTATVIDLAVFFPSTTVFNKRIYHVGYENRTIVVEPVEFRVMGDSRDMNIEEVE